MNIEKFEKKFELKIVEICKDEDPAHDLLHFKRVVKMAKKLCHLENANQLVVVPAAWLHDFVIIRKDDPLRSKASRLAAERAIEFLKDIQYPKDYFDQIFHAIEGHSFSANIDVKTLEAKIVQDADRLDSLGAIGIARCFATTGLLKRSFYCENDPLCAFRPPEDRLYAIDHFYIKLFKIAETLKTKSAQQEGQKRVQIMKDYLEKFKDEIG